MVLSGRVLLCRHRLCGESVTFLLHLCPLLPDPFPLIFSQVGFGNVWQFPSLVYEYGGAAFFIPYALAVIFVGLPILVLEVALGQYYETGGERSEYVDDVASIPLVADIHNTTQNRHRCLWRSPSLAPRHWNFVSCLRVNARHILLNAHFLGFACLLWFF